MREVASLRLRIEQLQGRIVQGQDVDADQVIRLSSEHRRLLSQLRKKAETNKPSPTQSLRDYLESEYGSDDPAEARDDAEAAEAS